MTRTTQDVNHGLRTMRSTSVLLNTGEVTLGNHDLTASRSGNFLSRSDLIRRVADKSGWREPTPYGHRKISPGYYAGTFGMKQERRYLNNRYVEELECQFVWPDLNFGATVEGWRDKLTPPQTALVPVPSSTKNEVKAKLRVRLKNEQWNAAVMLREMKSSVDMITRAATTLQRALFQALRKDWVGVSRTLGVSTPQIAKGASPANGWLAFHFGWAPIIADAVGAANFLATVGEHEPRLRVAAGASFTDESSPVQDRIVLAGSTTAWYVNDWSINYTRRDAVKTDYKIICWYRLDDAWLRDLSKIGFTNPAELIYATTPFTWLFDWLIPVGQVLQGLDATIGLKFISGTETTYREVRRKVSGAVINMPVVRGLGTRTVLSQHGEALVRGGMQSDSDRRILTSTPFPKGLWINNPFSPWRIATSAAVMRQLAGKFRFKT